MLINSNHRTMRGKRISMFIPTFEVAIMVNVSRWFKILVILYCFSLTLSYYPAGRDKRTFLSLMNRLYRFSNCGLRSCPSWKCQDDSAVIHGYCCQCPGSEYDNVPVPCYPDLKCPLSMGPLCSDYNFMMNCCCTGS